MADHVWAATISHPHGLNLYVHKTEEGLDAKIRSYIKEWWDDRADREAPAEFPQSWDFLDLRDAYFEGHNDELLEYFGQTEVRP